MQKIVRFSVTPHTFKTVTTVSNSALVTVEEVFNLWIEVNCDGNVSGLSLHEDLRCETDNESKTFMQAEDGCTHLQRKSA